MKSQHFAISLGVLFGLAACTSKQTQETPRPTLPVIAAAPQNTTVNIGSAATFSVDAPGGAYYQWSRAQFDSAGAISSWTAITGAVLSSYTFTPTLEDIKTPLPQYRVEVFDETRILSLVSAGATLSVLVPAGYPLFTTQPQDLMLAPGGTAVFTVANSGLPAPALQWQ